ncbi:hypothetical protein TNCV_4366101 [Trichonephila clavipes]|nr:hypothetical protein TNCV_4366101 [Trichonephila clavipes]
MVDDLWHLVEAAWASVPVYAIQSLFDSKPRLITTVNSPSKQNRECFAASKTVDLGNRTKGVSSQTVRNRLHEGGLYARRPMVCIPLTPSHRAARRRWAAEHRDWEQHDWS